MQQLDLFDAGAAPRARSTSIPRHTLFFMIAPPHGAGLEILSAGRRIREDFALHQAPRPQSVLHASLLGVGRFAGPPSGEVIAFLNAVGEAVDFPAFDICLDAFCSFDDAVVLVGGKGSDGLVGLGAALQDACRARGLRHVRGVVTPHVTVLYEHRRRLPMTRLSSPINWRVNGFRLVDSLHGLTRHRPLGQFALAPNRL